MDAHLICALIQQLERIADALVDDLAARKLQASAVNKCDLKEMESRLVTAINSGRELAQEDVALLNSLLKGSGASVKRLERLDALNQPA